MPLEINSQSASSPSKEIIFALASGGGALRQPIAVMRVSGKNAGIVLEKLAGPLPKPRMASLRLLAHRGEKLDQALVIWMPGPNSYTGEDSFELHLHGASAVIEGVGEALSDLGARPAEAGEFTKRALHNGKMDLLQAEAICDLVEAESSAQRRQALGQVEGGLSRLSQNWQMQMTKLLARLEAQADFPEDTEDDISENPLLKEIQALYQEIQSHLSSHSGEILREGLTIVLAGAPNAGKSSLLNALAEREAAIVAPIAGTTRDAISLDWTLNGVKTKLVDTAGLRETEDLIEKEGVKRAKNWLQQADVILYLIAPRETAPNLSEFPKEAIFIPVYSKSDLHQGELPENAISLSVKSPEGLKPLKNKLEEIILKLCGKKPGNVATLTRPRHRHALTKASEHLEMASDESLMMELRTEEMRLALQEMGRLSGKIGGRLDPEKILDQIFSEFCIGK
ncbi:tRNA uridine-5-carboxymethylaminomethyl(34) synthesis GTPase MnmE [Acetobacteraceae bacterium]|nr:tRNA uridine-5-carboxymethylaminomethyl(34) synthesis GTPase MnmE [Acetobacteraceae bacterium]